MVKSPQPNIGEREVSAPRLVSKQECISVSRKERMRGGGEGRLLVIDAELWDCLLIKLACAMWLFKLPVVPTHWLCVRTEYQ